MHLPRWAEFEPTPLATRDCSAAVGFVAWRKPRPEFEPEPDVLAPLRATGRDLHSGYRVADHSGRSATERLAEVWSAKA